MIDAKSTFFFNSCKFMIKEFRPVKYIIVENYLKEYFLYLLMGKVVLNSKLPEELVALIMDFKPRDTDMKHQQQT